MVTEERVVFYVAMQDSLLQNMKDLIADYIKQQRKKKMQSKNTLSAPRGRNPSKQRRQHCYKHDADRLDNK